MVLFCYIGWKQNVILKYLGRKVCSLDDWSNPCEFHIWIIFFLFNYEYFQDEQKLLTIKYNEVTLKIFLKQKVGVVKYCRAVWITDILFWQFQPVAIGFLRNILLCLPQVIFWTVKCWPENWNHILKKKTTCHILIYICH